MMLILSDAIVILLGVATHFLPGWMRPDIYFAVRVDPEFRRTEAARRILTRYRVIIWVSVAAGLAVDFFTQNGAALVVQVLGFLCAQIYAHQRTLPYAAPPATVAEADLSAPAEEFPGGAIMMFLPLVLLSFLAVWADRHFNQIPQRIPVHWNLHGANRWIERTHAGIAGYLGVSAAISLVFALMARGIFHWSRRISTRGPASDKERRFRRRNAQLMLLLSWLTPVVAWITLARPNQAIWGPILATGAILAILVSLLRYHQGPGDRAPDSCWKFGIFYYNPSDPSVFIPKRFGIGYTFNFGNRWTWILLGGVIVPIICVSVILK